MTSAAVIMVAVFSIFATLSFVDVKTLGVGLAFAVLVDATVVRGILVPAAMTLLGERGWYRAWMALSWLPGSSLTDKDDGSHSSPRAGELRIAPSAGPGQKNWPGAAHRTGGIPGPPLCRRFGPRQYRRREANRSPKAEQARRVTAALAAEITGFTPAYRTG